MKKQVHIHENTRSITDLLKQDSDLTKIEKRIIKLKNGFDDEEIPQTNEYENLDQLDQWKENVTNKKNVFYEQPIESQNKPNEFNFDPQQGPAINSMILNQIVKHDPKIRKSNKLGQSIQLEKSGTQRNKRDKDLIPSQMKTLEQVRLDMNKKLLNTLLLDKVQRNVDRVQKQQPWSMGQVEGETTNIFSEQARVLKQNTLNNFKGLNEYFRNPAQFIDYEEVLLKAKQYSNKPVAFQVKDNYNPTTQSMHSSKNMLETYTGIQQKIMDHKKFLYDLRIVNNTLVGEMQKIEEDILQLRRKFYGREERARNGITEQNVSLSPGKRLARSNIVDVLDRLRLQREQEEAIRHLGIQQIKLQIQSNQDKQQLIQKELDELREGKRKCKLALKEILNQQLLKADQGLCQDSLIQVVKSIRKINEVPKKELFPQYLDDLSINFISKAALLDQEIDDLRALNISNQNNTINTDQIAVITHNGNVSEIKQKVRAHFQQNRYLKSNLSQSKFYSSDLTNLTQEQSDLTFKATMSHLELGNPNSQHKDSNQRLVFLQQELENLSLREVQRNVKKYLRRRSEEELKDLRYIFYACFGANQGETHWTNFLNTWCEYHNLNPQRMNKFKQDQVGSDNHSSLPVVPNEQASKIKSTLKYLEQEPSVNYNYDLLGQVSKPKTAVSGFVRRYIK